MIPPPLIVPPALFDQIKGDPRFAALCERGDIRPNAPIPTRLDLGGCSLGLKPQADGSLKIVP